MHRKLCRNSERVTADLISFSRVHTVRGNTHVTSLVTPRIVVLDVGSTSGSRLLMPLIHKAL